MRRKMQAALPLFFSFLLMLLIWSLSSSKLNKPFLPSPQATLRSFWQMLLHGKLALHLWVSAYRVFLALLFSFIPAALLGIAMGRIRLLDRLLSPVLYLLYPLPKVVFLPILVVMTGLGDFAKISLIVLVLFFQLLMVARDAAQRIAPAYLLSARALGMKRGCLFFHVLLPACLPRLFTALRIGIGTAIAILFFAESFASVRGVGYLITDAMSRRDYEQMYAGILAMALLGLGFYLLVELGCKATAHWQAEAVE